MPTPEESIRNPRVPGLGTFVEDIINGGEACNASARVPDNAQVTFPATGGNLAVKLALVEIVLFVF